MAGEKEDGGDLVLELARLARRAERLRSLAERAEEGLHTLRERLRELAGRGSACGPFAALPPASPKPRQLDAFLEQQAAGGVGRIEWLWEGADRAAVSFDGRPAVTLKQAQAVLLRVLADARTPATDDMAGWKTAGEIVEALGGKPGGAVSLRGVRQSVYLLRRMLREQGENPYFVQHRRGRGYRFALRGARGQGSAAGNSAPESEPRL